VLQSMPASGVGDSHPWRDARPTAWADQVQVR
jgi:hypothetical protein